MIIFRNEEPLEEAEVADSSADYLRARLVSEGIKKTEEPLGRNKRLQNWPSEITRREIFADSYSQQSGLPTTRENVEKWKQERAEVLWEEITAEMEEEERKRVLWEYGMSYIAALVSNTIHLERLYTALKPIGEKQWELSQRGVRDLVREESILTLTEKTESLQEKGKIKQIPEWIKGAIIYLSLQGSRRGQDTLNPKSQSLPDMNALKTAANWCLGNHLVLEGTQHSLEETNEIFHVWHKKREKIGLEMKRIPYAEIPEEIKVPAPTVKGEELPWNLSWRILPVLEKEIRALGERVLENTGYQESLGSLYKKKLLERWASGIARRSYIRKWEEKQGVAERWRTRALIFTPIDSYISTRIAGDCPQLRLLAKTEAAWQILTNQLPEPEL